MRCGLLLPSPLPGFILREQAEDLLRSVDVEVLRAGRVPAGLPARLPGAAGDAVARTVARRMTPPTDVLVIFHCVQWPLAQALLARSPGVDLWYWRWDRYEAAGDADPARRSRLQALHLAATAAAAVVPCASVALLDQAVAEGARDPLLAPLAADAFPALGPDTVVAAGLGHLGRRVDWALLRGVLAAMPELRLVLIGERHDSEMAGDGDFPAVRDDPRVAWLGRLPDEAAATVLLGADVAILPFIRDIFNDAGLPYRILKAARLGRKTVVPPLAGVRTWPEAIVEADSVEDWVAALRAAAGGRADDPGLRAWAAEQRAAAQNAPLWERLAGRGITP